METSIVGVGVGITDRFRTVVEEKIAKIQMSRLARNGWT